MGHINEAFKLFTSFQSPTEDHEKLTLDSLVQHAKKNHLHVIEQKVLDAYLQGLPKEGLTEAAFSNQVSLCKILILQSRDKVRSGKAYRALCDQILPLFSKPEAKLYFLDFARNFYPFWIELAEPEKTFTDTSGPNLS